MDTLFEKNKNVRLYYSIDDIKNILNIEETNDNVLQVLRQIKHIRIDNSQNIIVHNYANFFKEYENYIM